MNRFTLLAAKTFRPALRRQLHKGVDSTPPLRFTSITEKLTLFTAIWVSFLSYPTYVLFNLDNLRPRADNALKPEVQEQIDQLAAARAARK